jgi:diguanylate cyclase
MTSSDTSSSWRDKYLQSLDNHERLQRQSAAHAELLRKALVRISLVSDGLDPELDAAMGKLRNRLRKDTDEGLERVIAETEAALLSFERRRSGSQEQLQQALSRIVAVAVGADTRSGKQLTAEIARAVATPQELQGWITGLAALLQQTPGSAPAPAKGLFQRWFERDDSARSAAAAPVPAARVESTPVDPPADAAPITGPHTPPPPTTPMASVAATPAGPLPVEAILEGQIQTRAELAWEGPEAELQRPLHEPAFSRISDKVLRILTELLDNIDPAECVAAKAHAARLRIARGLNWYELVPTLEDIRDLVMQACLASDQEFSAYLLQVDQVLADISATLGLALQDQAREQGELLAFEAVVSEQVEAISVAVVESDSLEQLKQQVARHIVSIREALVQRPAEPGAESPLAQQLAELAAQVRTMEEEARSTRADLEAQRQKALQDPLTQLPNREAYSERVHQEFSRWQRYGRPLTLAVCDIDFFKRINDSFGHQAGDRVLQVLGRGIAKRLRDVDFMARYGGEEFVLVLPETSAAQALVLLDKIREGIAQTPFHFKEQPVKITLSMGIAGFTGDDTIEAVFARADARLYQAKAQGRNRCIGDEAAAETEAVQEDSKV